MTGQVAPVSTASASPTALLGCRRVGHSPALPPASPRRSSAEAHPATALLWPPRSPPAAPCEGHDRRPAALHQSCLPQWFSSLLAQSSPLASPLSHPSKAPLEPQPSCWVAAQPSCSTLVFTTYPFLQPSTPLPLRFPVSSSSLLPALGCICPRAHF